MKIGQCYRQIEMGSMGQEWRERALLAERGGGDLVKETAPG